jgi:hypothetical protein
MKTGFCYFYAELFLGPQRQEPAGPPLNGRIFGGKKQAPAFLETGESGGPKPSSDLKAVYFLSGNEIIPSQLLSTLPSAASASENQ